MKTDKITGRGYHYLTNDQQLSDLIKGGLIDSNQVLIGSFNNQSRFLLNDGTLAIVANHQPTELYNVLTNSTATETNSMIFYLGDGHAQIRFNCSHCDQGAAHNKFYDLNSKVGKSDTPFHKGELGQKSYINFPLNDQQANQVFSAISEIYDASEKGTYKYVELIHNCVALLTDVYKNSGLPHHFSQYFTDEELLEEISSDTGVTAYTHRFYYAGNYVDPDRTGIKDFVESKFGNNYTESWYYNKYDAVGIVYSGIANTNIDLDKAQDWPNILSKISEIKETRKTTYPELVKISSKVHAQGNDITNSDFEKISDYLIDKKITYKDLYYTYVLKHELEIARIFQDKPEGKQIIDNLIENAVHEYCEVPDQAQTTDLEHLCVCSGEISSDGF